MLEQSPREIIAAALGAVRFRCVDGTEQVIGQLAPQLADAVMAVLHEHGLVLCREQVGWYGYTHSEQPDLDDPEEGTFADEVNADLDGVDFVTLRDSPNRAIYMNGRKWAWFQRPVYVPVEVSS